MGMQPPSTQPGQAGTPMSQPQAPKIKYPTRLGTMSLFIFIALFPYILWLLRIIDINTAGVLFSVVVGLLTVILWCLPPDKVDEWLQLRIQALYTISPPPMRFFVIHLLYRDDFAISYLPVDARWAEWIKWHLMNIGYTVTLPGSWDGHYYIEYEMNRAFKKARHVFTVLSSDYLKILKDHSDSQGAGKNWYRYFLKYHRPGKQCIPAYVSKFDDGSLPPGPRLALVDEEDALNRLKGAIPGKPKNGPSLIPVPLKPPAFPGEKISTLPAHWYDGEEFIGRKEFLSQLQNLLRANDPGSSWPVAITALDGMGKTRTAYEYARDHKDYYDDILWIDGSSPNTLKESIKETCTTLEIMNFFQSPEQILKDWLEQLKTARWLLIIDDCSKETLDLIQQFIPYQKPEGNNAHILLTSHAQTIQPQTARSIELSPLALSDAQLFLLRQSGVIGKEQKLEHASQRDQDMANEICERDLGNLPFAIRQAGAYASVAYAPESRLSSLHKDFGKAQQRPAILNLPYHQANRPAVTVATNWLLAYQALENQTRDKDEDKKKKAKAALSLLELCAYLTSGETETIPEEILLKALSLDQSFSNIVSQVGGLNGVIEPLQNYSLVSWLNEPNLLAPVGLSTITDQNKLGGRLYMHRLLGTIIREVLLKQKPTAKKATASARQQSAPTGVPSWVEHAIKATSNCFPYVTFKDWPKCQRYRPTALTCIKLISQWQIKSLEAVRLQYLIASYLLEMGEYAEAQKHMGNALKMRKQVFDSGFPNLATCEYGVAELCRAQGRYKPSVRFYENAHNHFKNQVPGGILGDQRDANEAIILNGWGGALEDSDMPDGLDKAREKYNAALKVSAPTSLDYAVCLSNLAGLDLKTARYTEALQKYQEVGKILEGLGISSQRPYHPYYCHHLASMAAYFAMKRKYKEAVTRYEWAIREGQISLGSNHIQMAVRYASKAECLRASGKPEEAKECFEKARDIYKQYRKQYTRGTLQKHPHPSNNLMVKSYMLFLKENKKLVELELVWKDYKG